MWFQTAIDLNLSESFLLLFFVCIFTRLILSHLLNAFVVLRCQTDRAPMAALKSSAIVALLLSTVIVQLRSSVLHGHFSRQLFSMDSHLRVQISPWHSQGRRLQLGGFERSSTSSVTSSRTQAATVTSSDIKVTLKRTQNVMQWSQGVKLS